MSKKLKNINTIVVLEVFLRDRISSASNSTFKNYRNQKWHLQTQQELIIQELV